MRRCKLPGCEIDISHLKSTRKFCCPEHRVEYFDEYKKEEYQENARKSKSNFDELLDPLLRRRWV